MTTREAVIRPAAPTRFSAATRGPARSRAAAAAPGRIALGALGGVHEHEAERVARQAMRAPAPRRCRCGGPVGPDGECAACRAKRIARAASSPAARAPASVDVTLRSPGRPLPAAARAHFEPALGADLSAVRIHDDASADTSARDVGAAAYAVGSHIVFGSGRYQPDSSGGRELLGHELAHVLQARAEGGPVLRRTPVRPGPDAVTVKPAWEKRLRQSGPVDWQPGMRATLISDIDEEDHVAPDVWFAGGSLVKVLNVSLGQVQVQLLDPKARTKKPFYIDDLRLEPVGATSPASRTREGMHTQFQVQFIDEATARSLGVEPDRLVEGQPVSLPSRAPGVGVGWAKAPWPAFPVAPHGTGAQWTQTSFGHFSQFSNVPGSPTIGGYRSWGVVHGYQGLRSTPERPWTTAVPGRYFNDWWFRLMSPGTQTLVWREGTPQHAELVAELIRSGQYTEPYSFPPSTPGTRCTNCITVPRAETFGALGGRPVVVTDSGVYDITEFGRGSPNEPFTMEQAGRGKTMKEWLANPKVQTPSGRIEPLNALKVPSRTVWGTRGVTVIRAGGVIMLIYGIYTTAERLEEAAGTPYFDRVVAQETGSWIGGLLGGALGAAGAAGLACTPAGPGAFVCAAAGFVAGLFVGAAGSMLGAMGADYLYDQVSGSMETAGEILNPMVERAIWGDAPIPALGYTPPPPFGQRPGE